MSAGVIKGGAYVKCAEVNPEPVAQYYVTKVHDLYLNLPEQISGGSTGELDFEVELESASNGICLVPMGFTVWAEDSGDAPAVYQEYYTSMTIDIEGTTAKAVIYFVNVGTGTLSQGARYRVSGFEYAPYNP